MKDGRLNNISVAYPIGQFHDGFVSRKAYETDFLIFLSSYVEIVKLPVEYIEEGCEFNPAPDYLLVNIDVWGLELFALREQGKINMPFLIFFHVIYGQDIYISYLLPLLKKEDIVVVASEYSKKCLLNISEKFNNVHVIPLSIDAAEIGNLISKGGGAGKPKEKIISYLGQIIPEKGIGDLIECMPEILSNVNEEVSLNIIGPLSGRDLRGDKSPYVEELEKRAEELEVSQYINWKGTLLGDDKYIALARSDIFINPSVFKIETFGVVNIEALACGLPVICPRWSAFDEIITEGKNGFLIDVKENDDGSFSFNRSQLISRVCQLLNDENRLNKMKKEARKTAFNYHYRELMPKLVKLFKKKDVDLEGQWDTIKNKTFPDFRHLFQNGWLKVICADNIDYKSYDEILQLYSPGINFSKKIRHNTFKYLSGR